MSNSKSVNDITVAIAAKIRLRRQQLGISQEKLGEALGITFQQVQKYENGKNRISACRLVALAEALGCSAIELIPDEVGAREDLPPPLPASVSRLANRIAALPPLRRADVVTVTGRICEAIESVIAPAALEAAE